MCYGAMIDHWVYSKIHQGPLADGLSLLTKSYIIAIQIIPIRFK